jgi:RimJ/RimL family protein N-acetyltransferase
LETYPLELGWVVVLPSAQGGKSFPLCSALLQAARSQGAFATTVAENGRMQSTLGKLGFEREGDVWNSVEGDERLCLFTLNR